MGKKVNEKHVVIMDEFSALVRAKGMDSEEVREFIQTNNISTKQLSVDGEYYRNYYYIEDDEEETLNDKESN